MLDQYITLAPDYQTCRIINGGWQLSEGHLLDGQLSKTPVLNAFHQLADQGFNTFDCADIYTGVESLIGQFIFQRKQAIGRDDIQVHTKFVPDLSLLNQINYQAVEAVITRSLQRLNKEQLDLVQFHWWDYAVSGCCDVAGYLVDLQKKGLIAHLGTTNFDTAHLKMLLAAGYPLVSQQTQYSVLDRRPEQEMIAFCHQNNIQLLCYGTLAGGFLSEKWLDKPMPTTLENRSLVKYQLVIQDTLGWQGYQDLLHLMSDIGKQYHCSLSNVASAYVLNKTAVAAVIIGTRSERHIASNQAVLKGCISHDDCAKIDAFLAQYPNLVGEPFALERQEGGKHRNIMKMNLNES